MNQADLVYELPPRVVAAIAACALMSRDFDPIGATAAAFDAFQSGRAPLPAAPTAGVRPAAAPNSRARAGRRAGRDAVSSGVSA